MPKSKVVKQPKANATVVGEEGSWERVCELEEQLAHEQQSHDAEMIDAVSHYSALAVAELQDDIVSMEGRCLRCNTVSKMRFILKCFVDVAAPGRQEGRYQPLYAVNESLESVVAAPQLAASDQEVDELRISLDESQRMLEVAKAHGWQVGGGGVFLNSAQEAALKSAEFHHGIFVDSTSWIDTGSTLVESPTSNVANRRRGQSLGQKRPVAGAGAVVRTHLSIGS